ITVGASTNSHLFFAAVVAAGRRINALFGDGPKPDQPLTATVRDVSQLRNDGRACSALSPGGLTGAIALVQRGNCDFFTKVDNAKRAGAVGLIIYQYNGEEAIFNPAAMVGTRIPAVMVGSSDGLSLKSLA